ncbi:MAG: hypothetical protein U0N94_06670 [Clostridia bacterium]
MRKLNNKIKKIGAPILAGVLACSTALFYVPQMSAVHADTEKSINENFPEMLKTAQTGDKSETVYAVMDADGNTTDVSVSEWLKNEGKSNNLSDYSNLKNIKNTSGDEKMSRDGNKLVWAAKGKDIHYTGDYDGELPVNVKVSYYLNGTKVSADEIAGKKGNVKIRFDYDINDSVKENGYSLTRPYAIVSAVVLSNDNFTNVTVNNGKAVNDGNSTAVVGIALPGMSDNLQIDELDIPDHVTINAKTTNFEIDGTYTVADSGFMNDVDTTKLDDATGQIDELESALDKLSDASKKLVDGSSKLAKGANKLANSSAQIEEGTETLKDGTESMKTGSKDLKTGTGDLKTGVKDLSDGADKLVTGAQDLSAGTTQMKEGTKALNSSVNGAGGLAGDNGSAKNLSAGAARVDAGIKQMGETIAAQNDKLAKTAKSISDNLDGVNTEKVNAPSSADVDSALETAFKAAEASGDQDTINALKNAKEKLGTYETNVNDTVSSVNTDKQKITTANQTAKAMYQSITSSSNDDLKKLQDGADELKAGTQALDTAVNVGSTKVPSLSKAVYGLKDGAAQLDAGVNGYTDKDGKFHPGALLGLKSLQEGIKVDTKDKTSLVTGVNKLDAGTTKLANGAVQVDAGAGKLVTYMGQLTEGAETLSDGADTLASGMATFNKNGIQKLVSTLKDSDIKSTVNRVKATLDAASDGSFIGGKQEGQSGESKIIFKTDEVKKASKSDK